MQVHVAGNVPAGLYPLSIQAHDFNNPLIVLDTTIFYLIVQASFESGSWQAPKLNADIGETICTEEQAVCTDPDDMSGILDPVYLHSGEFVLGEAPDLKIVGRGIDYEFRRIYKSQLSYRGPLGANWQHNYDQFLVPTGTNLLLVDGYARADLYTSTNGISFTSPAGFYDLLLKNGDVASFDINLKEPSLLEYLPKITETADVIARTRPWSLRANAKYLGPLFLGWGISMGILVFERDLGMATLLLVTFALVLFVATRRLDLIVGSFVVFAFGAAWAVHHYAYVGSRIAVWRNPFADPLGAGYQAAQGYYSLASGGFIGTGYRLGHPGFIPDVATDYIYAALAEEFGFIGAVIVLLLYLALVRRMFAVALMQPDLYTKLLAVGLAGTLGFQVFIIVAGVIGLMPLTGITLPFISYGGSSLVANFLLVGLVWAMSGRPRESRPTIT